MVDEEEAVVRGGGVSKAQGCRSVLWGLGGIEACIAVCGLHGLGAGEERLATAEEAHTLVQYTISRISRNSPKISSVAVVMK
jgi:hypothetical protein